MDFISNQESQIQEMLKVIGISSVDELFLTIPDALKMDKILIDDGLSEYEGLEWMKLIASKNRFPHFKNYLGAGAYGHHIPSIIPSIASKAEFLTAYTPYQPEASQGSLQAIFEFQSAISALTGMDVSNASLYDGASSAAEGLLMALRLNKDKNKILLGSNIHPHYKKVVQQYLLSHELTIDMIEMLPDGSLDIEDFNKKIDDQTAAVLVSYPNFFGGIDPLEEIGKKAKALNVISIVCANPMVYGLYKNAKELFFDIAVGDCQPFGLPLQFGGPYVGYIACREEYVRQLPGRIVGKTIDTKGRAGFVLTLQAREQHIRREKATSNICSNQALAALMTLIGILWYGKEGVKEIALTNYQRTAYLREGLSQIPGIKVISQKDFFNEFVIKFETPLEKVIQEFHKNGIQPGVKLSNYFNQFENHLLVNVTETKSLKDLDHYLEVARKCL